MRSPLGRHGDFGCGRGRHHRELLARADGLVISIREQICRYTIGHTIAFLEEYCSMLPLEEESEMLLCGYLGYRKHKAEHDKFMAEVSGLKSQLLALGSKGECASYELSVETNRVIVDWRRDHIEKADKEFSSYLRDLRTRQFRSLTLP